MPFTLAHPAAVLPLFKTRLPLSALVVGTVAPDLEYMLRLSTRSDVSHTIPGLFVFCLPLGVLALWIFHRLIKQAAVSLLPDGIQSRLAPRLGDFPFAPASRFVSIACGVIVGAATHLLWDSFTHQDGWAVLRLPVLQAAIFETPWGSPHVFRILQHGSTLLGLLILALAVMRWYRAAPRSTGCPAFHLVPHQRAQIIIPGLLLSAAIAIGIAWLRLGLPQDFTAMRRFAVLTIVAALDAAVVASLAFAIAVRLRGARQPDDFQ